MDFETFSRKSHEFEDHDKTEIEDELQALQAGALQRIAESLEALAKDGIGKSKCPMESMIDLINIRVSDLEADAIKTENSMEGLVSIIDKIIEQAEVVDGATNTRLDALEGEPEKHGKARATIAIPNVTALHTDEKPGPIAN